MTRLTWFLVWVQSMLVIWSDLPIQGNNNSRTQFNPIHCTLMWQPHPNQHGNLQFRFMITFFFFAELDMIRKIHITAQSTPYICQNSACITHMTYQTRRSHPQVMNHGGVGSLSLINISELQPKYNSHSGLLIQTNNNNNKEDDNLKA